MLNAAYFQDGYLCHKNYSNVKRALKDRIFLDTGFNSALIKRRSIVKVGLFLYTNYFFSGGGVYSRQAGSYPTKQ